MDDHGELHARIDRICRRASSRPDEDVVAEMNDVLSEGYAQALFDERRLVALDERLVELLLERERTPELHRVAEERRAAARCIDRLREHLACMQEQFVVLGGGS